MNEYANRRVVLASRRVEYVRRPRRREVLPDTTVTDSWPPRLNTKL